MEKFVVITNYITVASIYCKLFVGLINRMQHQIVSTPVSQTRSVLAPTGVDSSVLVEGSLKPVGKFPECIHFSNRHVDHVGLSGYCPPVPHFSLKSAPALPSESSGCGL